MGRLMRTITVLLLGLPFLSGCWIEITVPAGGHVTGGSPANFCDAGQTCEVEVESYGLSLTFGAVADDGWIFMGWKKGWKHLCGGDSHSGYESCDLSTDNPYFPNNPRLIEIIESDEVFFLEPTFVRGTPIDTAIAAVADAGLRSCLRTVADDIGDVVYAEELPRLDCGNPRSLQGLEVFLGLGSLEIDGVHTVDYDLSPLQALTMLRSLALVGTGSGSTFDDTRELAAQLAALIELETLNLSRNGIDDLAPLRTALSQMKRLRRLNLFGNAISDLQPLTVLGKLTHLNLLANRIDDVGPLAALTSLQSLDLSGNSVSDIRPLAELKQLQTLNIIGSPIDDISPLQAMSQLQFLNMSGAQISNLAPLSGLRAMEVLRLRRNQVTEVDALAGLRRLYWIELRGNRIDDLGGLADLTRVEYLDLRENDIDDLSPLAGMRRLQELDLSQNNLVDVGPLAGLKNLREISLGGNAIVDPSPLAALANVEFLDLSANRIIEVGTLTRSLATGGVLLLSGNPLTCEEIDRLLSIENLEVVYEPLPAQCTAAGN